MLVLPMVANALAPSYACRVKFLLVLLFFLTGVQFDYLVLLHWCFFSYGLSLNRKISKRADTKSSTRSSSGNLVVVMIFSYVSALTVSLHS